MNILRSASHEKLFLFYFDTNDIVFGLATLANPFGYSAV